jgi:hypothetical protein
MAGRNIFLGLMPFWAPLSPPLGLSLLKSHLKTRGIHAVIHDFNTNDELWEILNRYFGILAEVVPLDKRSNFYMVGFDILGNHLTAYIHKGRESLYYELLRYPIRENYSIEVETGIITALDQVISSFYQVLSGVLADVFRETGPDLFGLSVYSPSLGPSLFSFKWVKARYPGVKTVMGGGVFADHLSPDSPMILLMPNPTKEYCAIFSSTFR